MALMSPITLPADEIHVWELAYRRAEGRAGLRSVLSGYLGVAPSQLVLEEEAHGRPRLGGAHASLDFSWSHSGERACVALARDLPWLGIDIEQRRPRPRALALARRFFAVSEAAWVAGGTDAAECESRFLRIWTAKEAILKAQGQGLSFGIARAALRPTADGLRPCWDEAGLGAVSDWQLHTLEPQLPDFYASLAWRDRSPRWLCWRGHWA